MIYAICLCKVLAIWSGDSLIKKKKTLNEEMLLEDS